MQSDLNLKTHSIGANITLLNTLSRKFQDDKGRYNEGLILVYKDNDTGIKYKQEFRNPTYTYYMIKPDYKTTYNRLFVEKDKLQPVTTKHLDIEKSIAEQTGNKQFFYDNARSNNRNENQRLHTHPDVFRSDMNIEDYYRFLFNQNYMNGIGKITKSYFDIEADTINMMGDFPQLGECPINAVTVILQDEKLVYTFLLRNKANKLIPEFEEAVKNGSIFPELADFVVQAVGGIERAKHFDILDLKYNILFYDEDKEIDLIRDMFNLLNSYKPDFCLAWNMSFDVPYIIERIKVLGYDPKEVICHMDFDLQFCDYIVDERNKNDLAERGDYALISSYSVFLDQMIQYASRRKGRTKPLSYSLDYTGETVCGVKKLDYKHITTNLSDLPYKDYKTFVFYNIMDVIVQVCIEMKTGDTDYVYAKSIMNNTRYPKVHRQTVYLANRGVKEFDEGGFIIGNNVNRFNEKPDKKFPGAFVADPRRLKDDSKMRIYGAPIYVFNNLNDFDYASLYPSIIRQFNVAANTQIGLLIIPDKISQYENRQNDTSYSRGGQFMEDYQSHVWLEVGSRWFNLANFTELVNDLKTFFTTQVYPRHYMRLYNSNGTIDPIHFKNTDSKMLADPMEFHNDIRQEVYMSFNINRALEWRQHAIAEPNQLYR
jgi:DNA polymerase elongation subunit (family B)